MVVATSIARVPVEMTAGTIKLFPARKNEAEAMKELSRTSCNTGIITSFWLQHQIVADEDTRAASRSDTTLAVVMPLDCREFPAWSLQSKTSCNPSLDLTPVTICRTLVCIEEGIAATCWGKLGWEDRKKQLLLFGNPDERITRLCGGKIMANYLVTPKHWIPMLRWA